MSQKTIFMKNGLFYALGQFLHAARWYLVFLWFIAFICCLPLIPKLTDPFKSIGFQDYSSPSAQANRLLNNTLGYSYNNFIVLYTSDQPFSAHPEYLKEIKQSLSKLKEFSIKNKIIFPTKDNHQISKDDHAAYAVILVNGNKEIGATLIEQFKKLIQPAPRLHLHIGGQPMFLQDTQEQTQQDLYKNEYVATPVAVITMLVVFGSVIAGLLPILLGGIAAILILSLLYFAGQFVSLSVFTLNIALLLGAILTLDYTLLIISRFREELRHTNDTSMAIAQTVNTSGKSVFFSGLAVLISLSALMLFRVDVLFSVGIGGLIAVLISMLIALSLLPALLSLLSYRINYLRISLLKKKHWTHSYWHTVITHVVKKPWFFACALLVLLLAMGYPFLHAKIGTSDYRILPKGMNSRDVFDIYVEKFGATKLDSIFLIAQSKNKTILEKENIGNLYDLVQQLKKDERIQEINSIVSLDPKIKKQQYQMLYTHNKNRLPEDLKNYLQISTKNNLTVITIISKYPSESSQTKALIEKLQTIKYNNRFNFQLTGDSVNTLDVKASIAKTFPYAFLWIVGCTYFILLLFLRSVILPFKAIITTILSLCASYGVLTLVFQEGHLHHLLHFEKQGMLDITLLIIIFCALFGVSMDYEVFLLTRIKEHYDKTHDNIKSIIIGIEHSSKIITSAAIIVILLCLSFMAADIIMVKAFGLGIAVAVFVDAFIIRALFVPAIMTLLGKWNWYLPLFLRKMLPEINFDHG